MGTKSLQTLEEDEIRIKDRIDSMEKNLHQSINEFKNSKKSMLSTLFEKMI